MPVIVFDCAVEPGFFFDVADFQDGTFNLRGPGFPLGSDAVNRAQCQCPVLANRLTRTPSGRGSGSS
eukprot:3338795-Rhodomonas_salina.2